MTWLALSKIFFEGKNNIVFKIKQYTMIKYHKGIFQKNNFSTCWFLLVSFIINNMKKNCSINSKYINIRLVLFNCIQPLFFSLYAKNPQSYNAITLLLDWYEFPYFLFKCFSKYGRHPLGEHRWTVYHSRVISYFPHFTCLVLNPLSWTSLPLYCFLHYLKMIHLRHTACDILGHAVTKRPGLVRNGDSSLKAFIRLKNLALHVGNSWQVYF